MQIRVVLCALVLGLGLLPNSSQAGIIFTLGNNPQPGEQNVLLNTGTTGNTVFGVTNQSNTLVEFNSSQLLTEPANGQARIEATNGTSQIGLTNVTISVPNGSAQDLIFNPDITGTIGTSGGTLTVNVTDNLGIVSSFAYTLSNGQNFLTITTTGGESIVSTSLSYSLSAGFTDLRQIRLSGLSVVPEPATCTMLATGLGILAVARVRTLRRKRNA
jgi:hypothetical protein